MSVVVHSIGTAFIEAGQLRLAPHAERSFALMLYLATERHRRLVRTSLESLLFPDQTDRNAHHSLRQQLYKFRQAGVDIEADRGSLHIAEDSVRIDVDDVLAS